jgi:predicted  nucleic acid-binding Zn-ribbon protein
VSLLGDIVASVRKVVLLEHRVATLASELERLSDVQTDTRERLIRLEVIIEEARRAGAARRTSRRRIPSQP